MSGMESFGAALGSLAAAADMAKAFLDVKTAVEVQGKVFELQRVILAAQQDTFAAQQSQTALLSRVRELEEEVAGLEAWEREKERYELKEVRTGALAYFLKPQAQGSDPAHKICPSCYQHRHISILALQNRPGRLEVWHCHDCGFEIVMGGQSPPQPTRQAQQRSNVWRQRG